MRKNTLILLGFMLLKFLLQYCLVLPEYDLHRDEYLHLDQANHLAWGFQSVPPFTSWVALLIRELGNDIFWVRFFPSLWGALTLLVVWKTTEALKGDRLALMLGALGVLLSVLLRLNQLFQPNSFDVLCWTLLYYILIRYINSKEPRWLYAGAVIFALAFYNKYNIGFLLLGLLPAILLTEHRQMLSRKALYGALLLGLLLVLPNLWWQYSNGFPVIGHMKELAASQLVNVNRADFLKEQLLYFIGSIHLLLLALYALFFYKPFAPYRLFGYALVFTLAIFAYFKAKGYYAIGLYPVFLAFGTVYLSHLLRPRWRMIAAPVLVAVPILVFLPLYQVAFPNRTPEYIINHQDRYQKFGLLRWEDGKDHPLPQDFADMLGWSELANKVDSVHATLARSGNTLVLCDNYGQAGAINYYSKRGIRAVTFNADYINWFDLSRPYVNLVRIKTFEGPDTEMEETAKFFAKAALADSIANPHAREFRTRIYRFEQAHIDVNARIAAEIKEVKSR
ncbi:ArnT family glycosyltransferase [Flavihumibacter petaseus]|nr:glycosyltransferase family 39 protein [Flavihumibacter petaseus]